MLKIEASLFDQKRMILDQKNIDNQKLKKQVEQFGSHKMRKFIC